MTKTETSAVHGATSSPGLSEADAVAARHYVQSTLVSPTPSHSFAAPRTPKIVGASGHPRDMSDRRTRGPQKVMTQLLEQLELDSLLRQDGIGRHDLLPES
jgi:hypothetical protein